MGDLNLASAPFGRLLITGGAGFIGTNLICRLRERGFRGAIRVLDNECAGNRLALAGLEAEFHLGDVRDRQSIRQAMSGTDQVIHLAADTTVVGSIDDPVRNYENNVLGTLNVLEVMREFGVSTIMNASTGGAIVGDAPPPVHEAVPPGPLSPYGASKLAAEGYCSAYAGSYGFRAVSLRFSNVYGPGSLNKGSVVATFMKALLSGRPLRIFGDGTQTRDYIFVGDLADGIISALARGQSGVYQLASGTPSDLMRIVRTLADVSGRVISPEFEHFRKGEVRHTYCDISKAARELGFACTTSLEDGVALTWNWFVRNAAQ
ncbi:MAG: NAD-dependent epimerase/dehydratase family protein [Pseudomonadota bacterium]